MCAVSENLGGICRRQKEHGKRGGCTVYNGNHKGLGRYSKVLPRKVKGRWYGI